MNKPSYEELKERLTKMHMEGSPQPITARSTQGSPAGCLILLIIAVTVGAGGYVWHLRAEQDRAKREEAETNAKRAAIEGRISALASRYGAVRDWRSRLSGKT